MKRTRWGIASTAVFLLALGSLHASTVIGLTIEDQARLSTHVVVGVVVGQEGIDNPENGLETAVTLRVLASLKGDTKKGDSLVFHTRSGELDGEISTALGETVLKTGQTVMVFVEDIDGRLYNLGLSYGVFRVNEDSRGRQSLIRALEDGLEVVDDAGVGQGPFALEDIRTRVNYAAAHPRFDNPTVQATFGEGR
jgi:hypothetical protein